MKTTLALSTAALLLAAACTATGSRDADLPELARRHFAPIEAADPAAVASAEAALGRALFWDARLSADGKTACATCHQDHGADRRAVSIDARGNPMPRHSPTVFNATLQPKLRWLADRDDAAQLSAGLITGPLDFKAPEEAVERMRALGYEARFQSVYGPGAAALSPRNYARALEAYQKTLATPAAFDRYLAGDPGALTPRQKEGLRSFIDTGCAGCHGGRLLGGTMATKFGLAADYWTETGSAKRDPGRQAITKSEADLHVFRVAPLRNVARTAPYFHDGSVADLPRAVEVMGKVQLGRSLDAGTVAAIVDFLESLSGEAPAHFAP